MNISYQAETSQQKRSKKDIKKSQKRIFWQNFFGEAQRFVAFTVIPFVVASVLIIVLTTGFTGFLVTITKLF